MYIGVDIGGTKCAVVCGERPDNILEKVSFKTESAEKTLEKISEIISGMGKADSIGISCGGPLDEARGIIMSPPNLPGWDDIHITDLFKSRFGIPVGIRNDANACALAEHRYGAGKGTENMVFLTFGTGLGAGIILGGRLYGGTSGMAGEVGHIRLSSDGPVGYGKRGSFEGFCSGGGIAQLGRALAIKAISEGNPPAFCVSLSDIDSITAKNIAECAKAGDATALEVLRVSGEKLGEGLSVIIDILNPQAIVIGSIFTRCGELLLPHAERVIEMEALAQSRAVCRILPAALGEEIGDTAALCVAEEILNK